MRQATISRTVSTAAGASNNNILATTDEPYRRAPFNCTGKLVANISAAGILIELAVDGRKVVDQSTLRVAAAAQLVEIPNDLILEQFYARKGSLMALKTINSTGGALNTNYRIVLEEDDTPQPAELITQDGPVSLAAGASINVLAGRAFERPRIDSFLSVYASASAAGMQMEIYIEQTRVSPPVDVTASNRVPINPFDILVEGIEAPNDAQIQVKFTNTTGGALNFFWRTRLQETALHPDMLADMG